MILSFNVTSASKNFKCKERIRTSPSQCHYSKESGPQYLREGDSYSFTTSDIPVKLKENRKFSFEGNL